MALKLNEVSPDLAQRLSKALREPSPTDFRTGSGAKKTESRSVIPDGGTCTDSPEPQSPRSQPSNDRPARPSYSKNVVAAWLCDNGIPEPEFEYRFHCERKWRFDVAWFRCQLAIEVQGGIWTRGRHTRGAALLKEYEKLNHAAALGWRILYITPDALCTMETITLVKRALAYDR